MSAVPRIAHLQPGDHLSLAEFERRYRAMPELKKAELIEGVVFMPMPVSDEGHGIPHFNMILWLGLYRVFTPGIQGGDNSTLRLRLGLNMTQPDGYLRIIPECGGNASVGADGYVNGAPDLIGEIAASSASYDLHEKLHAYEQNGVREYIVWRTHDKAIDWFVLREGEFKALSIVKGLFKSKAFPGLWLDPEAMINGDIRKVYQVAQEGLASAEHQRFVKKLASKKM